MSECWGQNNNAVVIVQGGVDVTLATTANQLLATGTKQVAQNSEASSSVVAPGVTTQTTHIIK